MIMGSYLEKSSASNIQDFGKLAIIHDLVAVAV
jgi:hypothetical protein